MKPIVLFASKGGNTQKIADQIASELSCESRKVIVSGLENSANLDNYNLIFIGTGIHFGNPSEDLVNYLKMVNPKEAKRFALFVTWGGAGKTNRDAIARLKAVLEAKGQEIIEDYFICYGGWNFLRRGHPNIEDEKAARKWAKKIVSSLG